MATLNIGMRVNRAITGATTVNVNATAIVTYASNSHGMTSNNSSVSAGWRNGGLDVDAFEGHTPVITGQLQNRFFGPSQVVPASFTTTAEILVFNGNWVKQATTITWVLQSGVELINTQ